MENYTYFSCEVLNVDKNFYINNLYNQFLLPKDIIGMNRTRKVKPSDFALNNIKVKRDMLIESECFNVYFLEDLTFYENFTVISCKAGDTRYYCGDFKLIFNQGEISHLNLKTQKFARLDWGDPWLKSSMKTYPKRLLNQSFLWDRVMRNWS